MLVQIILPLISFHLKLQFLPVSVFCVVVQLPVWGHLLFENCSYPPVKGPSVKVLKKYNFGVVTNSTLVVAL